MDRAAIRAKFKARGDAIEAPVPFKVPGLGPIFIKQLSAARASANGALLADENTQKRIIGAAACTICDEAGELVYDPTNAEDLAELGRIDMPVLTAIVQEANRINAQSQEGADEAGNV